MVVDNSIKFYNYVRSYVRMYNEVAVVNYNI